MNSVINQVSPSIRRFRQRTIFILPMAVAVFLFISFGGVPGAHAAESMQPKYAVASGKVISVYEAKEGDAVFKAYLVSWKSHRVVVGDSFGKTNYKEGDVISFIAMTLQNPMAGAKPDILAFQVVPTPEKSQGMQQ
jgi:hypothetical protein